MAARRSLGTLDDIDARKAAGALLNDAMTTVTEVVEARRAVLEVSERATQLEADRLDLTEVVECGAQQSHIIRERSELPQPRQRCTHESS